MTSQSLPESGTTSFTYDSGGRLSTKTDARSVVTTMAYDNANRVTQSSYSDSTPTVGFIYDQSSQTGLRTAMSDGLGSVAYTYDTMDRLTQESRTLSGISGTFSTSYNSGDVARSQVAFVAMKSTKVLHWIIRIPVTLLDFKKNSSIFAAASYPHPDRCRFCASCPEPRGWGGERLRLQPTCIRRWGGSFRRLKRGRRSPSHPLGSSNGRGWFSG